MSLKKFSYFPSRQRLSCVAVMACLAVPVAHAQPAPAADFGAAYKSVPGVSAQQAQVIFFRPATASPRALNGQGAHIYVDGEFHTSLLPQGYTRFCVRPGGHTIESYIGDGPNYTGKSSPQTQVTLEGGKTYFVAVAEDNSARALPYRRAEAESMLANTREQRHVLSRASTVQPCAEAPIAAVPPAPVVEKARYTLNADVLFKFGRFDAASLDPVKGRAELQKLIGQLGPQLGNGADHVVVRAHADPMGTPAYNQRLSEARAATVRQLLVEGGLPADRVSSAGYGSTQPVVDCAKGSRAARIACNAANRRVEVVVEGVK